MWRLRQLPPVRPHYLHEPVAHDEGRQRGRVALRRLEHAGVGWHFVEQPSSTSTIARTRSPGTSSWPCSRRPTRSAGGRSARRRGRPTRGGTLSRTRAGNRSDGASRGKCRALFRHDTRHASVNGQLVARDSSVRRPRLPEAERTLALLRLPLGTSSHRSQPERGHTALLYTV